MGAVCDSYCYKCIYFETQHSNCGYVLIKDELRGCNPGYGCTRRVVASEKLKQDRRNDIMKKACRQRTRIPQEVHDLRYSLYRAYYSDAKIAAATNSTEKVIRKWREDNNYICVTKLKEMEQNDASGKD